MKTPRERVAEARIQTQPVARSAEIEASIATQLAAGDTDPDALELYADWLQERGDPRGELIACQGRRGDAESRVSAIFREHKHYLLGIFAAEPDLPLDLSWHRGTIETARLHVKREHEDGGWDQGLLTDALLALPVARFVRELTLGCASVHEDDVAAATQEALERHGPLPTLRALDMVTDSDEEMLSWTETGPLGHLSETAPNLRALRIQAGAIDIGQPALPRLEELTIETCGMTPEALSAIARADWPALTSLTLWVGSRSYAVDIPLELVVELLDRLPPTLTHLGLCNNEMTREIAEALAPHPILSRLKSLSLSGGTLDDDGAAWLIENASAFHPLRRLDLSANYIQERADDVERAIPRVELGRYLTAQRHAEAWDGEIHRYADVGE